MPECQQAGRAGIQLLGRLDAKHRFAEDPQCARVRLNTKNRGCRCQQVGMPQVQRSPTGHRMLKDSYCSDPCCK